MREDRDAAVLRPVSLEPSYLRHPQGSALIRIGGTHVLCACTVEDRLPPFRKGTGQGWLTAEYALLPGSTETRSPRALGRGPSGRTHEIQRIIGRSLRAVVDFAALGERTLLVDADVIEADGGTRCAAITGAYVAVAEAVGKLVDAGVLEKSPLRSQVAAVSCGVIDGEERLDLDYAEDVRAEVDLNVVMTGEGRLVEIQGTAECAPFDRSSLGRLLDLAEGGIADLLRIQQAALGLAEEAGDGS